MKPVNAQLNLPYKHPAARYPATMVGRKLDVYVRRANLDDGTLHVSLFKFDHLSRATRGRQAAKQPLRLVTDMYLYSPVLANLFTRGNISTNYSLGLNASWELDLWGRVSGTVSASQASCSRLGVCHCASASGNSVIVTKPDSSPTITALSWLEVRRLAIR